MESLWRAVATGDVLSCDDEDARTRWALSKARCGVQAWAIVYHMHGDSSIAACAVLDTHDGVSARLFARLRSYFRYSVYRARGTVIDAELKQRKAMLTREWEEARDVATAAAANAKKDEGKANERTEAAKARAIKLKNELQQRLQTAEDALAAASQGRTDAATDEKRARRPHKLATRCAEFEALGRWTAAESPESFAIWADGGGVGAGREPGDRHRGEDTIPVLPLPPPPPAEVAVRDGTPCHVRTHSVYVRKSRRVYL